MKHLWSEISDDNLFTLAAALAYSWLFAIFPFLIFLLTLAPYLPEAQKTAALDKITEFIKTAVPKEAAQTMVDSVTGVVSRTHTNLLSIGLVATLWAASGGVSMTMSGLDAAFDVPVRPFYTQRPVAILLTIVVTVLILLIFIFMPIGSAVVLWLSHTHFLPPPVIWSLNLVRYGFALLFMFAVLAALYRFGTSAKSELTFFSPGSVFTVVVWCVLAEAFRFYVDKFGRYEKMYGAVGGVAILLLFFYVDALVLLIGAEINSEVDNTLDPKPAGATRAPA